jgi:hypothetical protein
LFSCRDTELTVPWRVHNGITIAPLAGRTACMHRDPQSPLSALDAFFMRGSVRAYTPLVWK